MHKKKREKPEDFIGWKSPDGKLEVIGIAGYQNSAALFKVTCIECSKDKELFPEGYFISNKSNLRTGRKPCGCSNSPKWFDWQYLILASRAAKGRFIVHGFSEELNGKDTKLDLECLKDGHKWTASINNIINKSSGCPKCRDILLSNQRKIPENTALQNCIDICKEMDYDIIGFVSGYKNNRSYFEYICKIHGKQSVNYDNFINKKSRCGGCARDKQKDLGNRNGYYPERKDEQDYLYILNFNNKFIKVGRSFIVDKRIDTLKSLSQIKKIYKLRIFTATHQEVYD